jgi:hypothetical protein
MAKQNEFAKGRIAVENWPLDGPTIIFNSVRRGFGRVERVEHCMNIKTAEWYRNELDKAIRYAKKKK